MVYYRKYRPQTIEDLDNEAVRSTLKAIFSKTKDIPHAFLFTGPKGLGKTSAARIVAKVINCETSRDKRKDGFEPCGTCEQCLSITAGTNLDVLEIDGASNRGIDEIRSLRDKVNLSPANPQTKRKVYIIDEVHMLTTEAFNALLKTIEEPPKHVMFIFCTTEAHKVPETILSRCFHVSFSLATSDEIVRSLQRVAVGEKLEIKDKNVFYEIAKLADGGFRDATKILEEMNALYGNKIEAKDIQDKYHTASILLNINNLLSLMKDRKTKESLAIISDIVEKGIDIKFFTTQILSQLNAILLKQMNIASKSSNVPQSLTFRVQDVSILYSLFSEAYNQLKYTPIPQLPLEIAIISWTQEDTAVNSNEVSEVVSHTRHENKNTVDAMRKKHQALKFQSIISGKSETKNEPKVKDTDTPAPTQGNIHKSNDELTSLLDNLIYKVKPFNHSVAGVLRGSKVESFSNEEIVFITPYKFHKERLEDRKSCEIIEKALKEITGKSLKVSVILKS